MINCRVNNIMIFEKVRFLEKRWDLENDQNGRNEMRRMVV